MMEFEMSVDKLIDIAKTLSTITIALPNGETVIKTLFLANDQKLIEPVNTALGVQGYALLKSGNSRDYTALDNSIRNDDIVY